MTTSAVRATIDLDRRGKWFGQLLVPDSRNDAAWASLAVPIVCVANDAGPTVLVIGGTHGDEYEGQVPILNLARGLEPKAVRGRILLVPCLSIEAALAGTRLWPDGTNFNRAFPGASEGPPAPQLAYYLSHVLFPLADVVCDVHSGGRSLLFHPMTVMHCVEDPELRTAMLDAMLAWNADFHMLYVSVAGTGLLPWEASRQGKVVVTTELGGGAHLTRGILDIAESGLRNVLRHLGVLEGRVETRASLGLPDTMLLKAASPENYVIAPVSGLYEPLVDAGTSVEAGQPIGRVHFPERPEWRPEPVQAPIAGIVGAIRGIPMTRQGAVVATIGEVCDRAELLAAAAGAER